MSFYAYSDRADIDASWLVPKEMVNRVSPEDLQSAEFLNSLPIDDQFKSGIGLNDLNITAYIYRPFMPESIWQELTETLTRMKREKAIHHLRLGKKQ